MNKRRVVITGMGSVSPFGVGVDKLWNSLKDGKSGISHTDELIDLSKHTIHIGGVVRGFKVEDYIDEKEAKRMDRFIQFAVIAADEAVKDAKLEDLGDIDPYRVGVIVSSAAGGFPSFENNHKRILERGMNKCSPFTIPMIIVNMPAGHISLRHGFKGMTKAVVSACATGTHSIGDAFRSIQYDDADIILAGGSEAVICDVGVSGFAAARTLSKRNDEPEKASRPFDIDRDGFVMSEGAGVVVLEEYEHAKKRGAKIYAEIIGYGQTSDAYDIVAPDPTGTGVKKVMQLALKDAGLKPEDIDYVNVHGTSTGLGDVAESNAVAEVFGDKEKNPHLLVSSTKSMHGHILGATGAIEIITCVKALNEGIVPPTINLDNQDEHVANLDYVPHKARKAELKNVLSNSFGFGGQNASLVITNV
ncbi:beta-ketoacyl-ACP synthase II [bacterium]|nr:beta-ketoacyl-ACP synthase II [bacterium]